MNKLSCAHGAHLVYTLALTAAILVTTGCRGLAAPMQLGGQSAPQVAGTDNPVVQVSGEQPNDDATLTDKTKDAGTAVLNFMTGHEQENFQRARSLYQQGNQLFLQAKGEPDDQARKTFQKAAKLFGRAGEAAPKTALEQDAMFMQGESLFFADRLTEATDVYERLQKNFPRNRHVDNVAARLFAISRYWIETVKAKDSWFTLNLTDPKRPRLDVDGHALRVLDQIRYDDPTGRLADDATMAAAVEYIRQRKFEEADEFLTDLRETYSDSEHLFLAHLMGIRCKLESYAGPAYSGLVLEEADKLVRQTRQRFPDKLAEKDYGEMVARAAAEIDFKRAERVMRRANYREKRKEFGAARYQYNLLLQKHPNAPQAETARERLAKIEERPAVPTQRLSWLTTLFPDQRSSKAPLKMDQPADQPKQETMLR